MQLWGRVDGERRASQEGNYPASPDGARPREPKGGLGAWAPGMMGLRMDGKRPAMGPSAASSFLIGKDSLKASPRLHL